MAASTFVRYVVIIPESLTIQRLRNARESNNSNADKYSLFQLSRDAAIVSGARQYK